MVKKRRRKLGVCVTQSGCLRDAKWVFASRKVGVCVVVFGESLAKSATQIASLRHAKWVFASRNLGVCVTQIGCLRALVW